MNKNLLPQIAGGAVWAVFFIFAPFVEFVILGSILWLPLLIWRERRRSARYGFLPGAAWRYGIIVLAVTLAALAPTKHEDGRVGPLQSTSVTLAELVAARIIYPLSDSQYDGLHVTVPSLTPTRREVMRAISEQTGLRASIFHCGNAATVFFGSGGGLIRVSGETTQPRPNHALQRTAPRARRAYHGGHYSPPPACERTFPPIGTVITVVLFFGTIGIGTILAVIGLAYVCGWLR